MKTLIFTVAALFFANVPLSVSKAQNSAPLVAMSDDEQTAPEMPSILSMRDRAEIIDRILSERLETIIPAIMREQGVDLWLLMSREYFEEPVVASMLDARSMSARRRT
ncbi:MAG: Xaa-Pro aminopeptidase, partial [Pseudomonadota bacterium]